MNVLAVGGVQRVAQHLLGIGERPRGEHCELPVVVVGGGRRHREAAAHERPTADGGGGVPELGETAVDPHGREMVDRRLGGKRAGRRQLGTWREIAVVDEPCDVIDELLGERRLPIANKVQHAQSV